MGLVTLPCGMYLPPWPGQVSSVPDIGNAGTIDAAGELNVQVLRVPKTGNIAKVAFRVQVVTSAPTADHDVRIETVDAATGLNTGTLQGTNTNLAVRLDSTGWKTVTLTAVAAVTIGDLIAVVIKAPGANFGNINLAAFSDDGNRLFPYAIQVTVTKIASAGPVLALEYDDGSYAAVDGLSPYTTITQTAFNNASNPTHRAVRFQVPMPVRLAGCWFWGSTAGDFDIVFFAADGITSTVLASVDKDVIGTTGGAIARLIFASPQTLLKDTYYRLAIVPTSASNVTVNDGDVNAAAIMDAFPGGQGLHLSTANGAPSAEGDWTQTLTSRPFMGLRFDQFDDGFGARARYQLGVA